MICVLIGLRGGYFFVVEGLPANSFSVVLAYSRASPFPQNLELNPKCCKRPDRAVAWRKLYTFG